MPPRPAEPALLAPSRPPRRTPPVLPRPRLAAAVLGVAADPAHAMALSVG